MWRELVRVYAIQAREFSEIAARLGKQASVGPEFLELCEEVKKRHALCNAAGEQLYRYIEQMGPAAKSKKA